MPYGPAGLDGRVQVCLLFHSFRFVDSFPLVLLSQATQVGDIILSVDSESVVGMVPRFSPHYASSPSFRRATACVDDSSANSRSSWHLRLAQFLVAFIFKRVHVRQLCSLAAMISFSLKLSLTFLVSG